MTCRRTKCHSNVSLFFIPNASVAPFCIKCLQGAGVPEGRFCFRVSASRKISVEMVDRGLTDPWNSTDN